MKKLSLFTALAVILSFSSCEEDPILGCNDTTAINYDALVTEDDGSCEYLTNADLIIGSWSVDSLEIRVLYPQETLDQIMLMATMMSPEEFYEEFEFEMPTSDVEWNIIATEGVLMDNEDVTGIVTIDNQNITLDMMDDLIESTYILNDDSIISFVSNPDEIDSFTIVEVDETNLILSSLIIDEDYTGNITLYLSK
jgi:hypothetical protein